MGCCSLRLTLAIVSSAVSRLLVPRLLGAWTLSAHGSLRLWPLVGPHAACWSCRAPAAPASASAAAAGSRTVPWPPWCWCCH